MTELFPRLNLDRSIPVLLTFAANRLNSTGSAAYRNRLGIGIIEARLLMMLAVEPDIHAARIREVMGIDLGAPSRTLRDLEGRALVRYRPDNQNRAYRRWSLTDAGELLDRKAVGIARERAKVLKDALTADERNILLRLLKRIIGETPQLETLNKSDRQ